MISDQHGLSFCGLWSGWSQVRVVSHRDGLSSAWSLIRVVSRQLDLSSWLSVIRVISHQGGLLSGWSLVRVSYQGALSLGWSFIRVVSRQGFHRTSLTRVFHTRLVTPQPVQAPLLLKNLGLEENPNEGQVAQNTEKINKYFDL